MGERITAALRAEILGRMDQQRRRAATVLGPEYVGRLRTQGLHGLADALEQNVARAISVNAQAVIDAVEAAGVCQPVVDPEPPPPPPPDPEPPTDEYAPPARDRVVEDAPDGATVQAGTFYLNPRGSLSWPAGVRGVTVVGLRRMTTILKGVRDVHIQGHPDRWMESGPRGDGNDLLQIKATEAGGTPPEDVTLRYWWGHDVTRPAGKHSDGLQLMAGRRIRIVDALMERVNVQPFFVRDAGYTAAGGPIEDVLFHRAIAVGQTEGFYTFNVAGDDEEGKAGRYVPTRVRLIDCGGDKNATMDAAARRAGGEIIGWRSL